MKWRKTIFVVVLASMTVFAIMGCGKAEEPTPAVEQPSPAVEQTTPTPGGTMPLPTDEGTMPAPPEGGAPGERPPAPAMDLAAAAAKLGVTEQQLRDALGDVTGQKLPDFATAAKKLGISEKSLREALGLPADGGMPAPDAGGPPPGTAAPR